MTLHPVVPVPAAPTATPTGATTGHAAPAVAAGSAAGVGHANAAPAPVTTATAATGAAQDAARWQAVRARDARADGQFVYAVRTTGVYCRPSCGARAARPAHVVFFDSGAQARAAGYRACLRCQPDLAPLRVRQAALVAQACRHMAQAQGAPALALAQLAAQAGLSASHFHRIFKAHTGLTPKAYAQAQRGQALREGLARGASVTEALHAAGYPSASRFYAQAPALLGMAPRAFRAGGVREQLRLALGRCSLGAIAVAASAQGVCAIVLGDDPQALVHDLQRRFAQAQWVAGDAQFAQWVAQALALVEAPHTGVELPLDVRGTAFQERVWQALRALAPGSTVSYQALAARIGAPGAARAVAGACAANALAVAIPCHRVVRSDGALSGYRWGVERKRALLEREAAGVARAAQASADVGTEAGAAHPGTGSGAGAGAGADSAC